MNNKDRSRVKNAAEMMLRLWKDAQGGSDDPWHNLQYKQAMRDALQAMKRAKLIKDFDLNKGVTLPTNEEMNSQDLF